VKGVGELESWGKGAEREKHGDRNFPPSFDPAFMDRYREMIEGEL
jgi:hypothetical protein